MTMLVTGASGFIGRRVTRGLLEAGHRVMVLGRRGSEAGTTHVAIDLLNDDPASTLGDVTGATLVHLAWYAEPGRFWSAVENLDWVAASLRLLRCFARMGGRRVIVAGTCAEYEWGDEPLTEDVSALEPATLYGTSKVSLYKLAMAAAPVLGIEVAWARIFNPYGPDEAPQRLLGHFLAGVRSGGDLRFSAGQQKRDFIHVDDVAAAIVCLAESQVTGAVNVASGDARTVREFIETAGQAAQVGDSLRFGERPLAAQDVPLVVASIQRLVGEVGFTPRFGFADGIADAIARGLGRREAG